MDPWTCNKFCLVTNVLLVSVLGIKKSPWTEDYIQRTCIAALHRNIPKPHHLIAMQETSQIHKTLFPLRMCIVSSVAIMAFMREVLDKLEAIAWKEKQRRAAENHRKLHRTGSYSNINFLIFSLPKARQHNIVTVTLLAKLISTDVWKRSKTDRLSASCRKIPNAEKCTYIFKECD